MLFKVENKLPHVNQLLNVFFAFILFNVLKNLYAGEASIDLHRLTVVFVLSFFILYAWWRQNDVYLSSNYKNAKYLVFAGIRVVLVSMLAGLQLELFNNNAQAILPFLIIGVFIYCSSIWQFTVTMQPTYGKIRVFLKREIWADSLFLIALILLLAPIYLGVSPFSATIHFASYLLALFVARLFAKSLTRWKEAAPPHRGGKGRRDYNRGAQVRRSGGRGSSPDSSANRPSRSSGGGRGSRAESDTRSKRPTQDTESRSRRKPQPRPKQSQARPATPRTQQRSEKRVGAARPAPNRTKKSDGSKPQKPAENKKNELKKDKPAVVMPTAEEPQVEVTTSVEPLTEKDSKVDTSAFGKRNAKPKRPKFDSDENDDFSTLTNNRNEKEGEAEITFGRTPKKKSR